MLSGRISAVMVGAMIGVLLVTAGAASAQPSFFRDDFNGPALNVAWRQFRMGDVRYDLEDGALNIRDLLVGRGGRIERYGSTATDQWAFSTRFKVGQGPDSLLGFNPGSSLVMVFAAQNTQGELAFLYRTGFEFERVPLEHDRWYTVESRMIGSSRAVWLDGTLLSTQVSNIVSDGLGVGFGGTERVGISPMSVDYVEFAIPAPAGVTLAVFAMLAALRRRR